LDYACDVPVLSLSSPSDLQLATQLRDAHLPFVLSEVPELDAASRRWSSEYLRMQFGHALLPIDVVRNGHTFSWFSRAHAAANESYTPKSDTEWMTFEQWESLKQLAQKKRRMMQPPRSTGAEVDSDSPHYYLQTHSDAHPFLRADLPIYTAPSFFVDEVSDPVYRSVSGALQCRFGDAQLHSAAHFDIADNFVAMVRGSKQYVLMEPDQCEHVQLQPYGPDARHTQLDWSDPKVQASPAFQTARALHVHLKAGQVLYLPSHWLHAVTSVDDSIQCNQRNRRSRLATTHLARCGFPQAHHMQMSTLTSNSNAQCLVGQDDYGADDYAYGSCSGSNPCQNGGTCSETGLNFVTCNCQANIYGACCAQTQCSSGTWPCNNGGTCVVQSGVTRSVWGS
jgi:hypothetical protein